MRKKTFLLRNYILVFFPLVVFLLAFPSCKSAPPSEEPLVNAAEETPREEEAFVPAESLVDDEDEADLTLPPVRADASEAPAPPQSEAQGGESAEESAPEISVGPAPSGGESAEPAPPPEAVPPDLPETAFPPDQAEKIESNAVPEKLPDPLPAAVAEPETEPEPLAVPPPAPVPPPEETEPAPAAPLSPPPPGETSLPPLPPAFLRPPEKEAPPPGEDPVPPAAPIQEPPAPPPLSAGEEIVFSRVVRAVVGQLVEIPFRGAGWVYLGELGSRRGISYDSRRLDPEGQTFVFRAGAAGTYVLKFYKQDFIRDYVLNDYVQVIIGEAPVLQSTGWFNPPLDSSRVIAEPRWPPVDGSPVPSPPPSAGAAEAGGQPQTPQGNDAASSPETETRVGEIPPSVAGSVIPQNVETSGTDPVSTPEVAAPLSSEQSAPPPLAAAVPQIPPMEGSEGSEESIDDYTRRAKEEYDAGRTGAALSLMEQTRRLYPVLSDEALWLYGQLLEANGPGRDIRLALDYYRRLVREYPQSPRFPDAARRISYLERYYFNIK